MCLRVQWKPSEEWKPFFQLNNGTAVQLKTCSGWLHSPTTSPDTATQSSGDSKECFLWVQHFFHFSWEKVILKVFLLTQKQALFLSQLWAAATLLTSATWTSCDAKSRFHTMVTLNMLVWACIYCVFMFLYMRMALELSMLNTQR